MTQSSQSSYVNYHRSYQGEFHRSVAIATHISMCIGTTLGYMHLYATPTPEPAWKQAEIASVETGDTSSAPDAGVPISLKLLVYAALRYMRR